MKVTGWTHWDNENYIDIGLENSKIKGNIMNSLSTKWPKFNPGASVEEKQAMYEQMQQHIKEMDVAFENSVELKESNQLCEDIYQTVIEDIRNNRYHFTGDQHQNCEYGVPVVDDKYTLKLSMRSWGRLIREAFPEEFEEDDTHSYVVWAWYANPKQDGKRKIPDKLLWIE